MNVLEEFQKLQKANLELQDTIEQIRQLHAEDADTAREEFKGLKDQLLLVREGLLTVLQRTSPDDDVTNILERVDFTLEQYCGVKRQEKTV